MRLAGNVGGHVVAHGVEQPGQRHEQVAGRQLVRDRRQQDLLALGARKVAFAFAHPRARVAEGRVAVEVLLGRRRDRSRVDR